MSWEGLHPEEVDEDAVRSSPWHVASRVLEDVFLVDEVSSLRRLDRVVCLDGGLVDCVTTNGVVVADNVGDGGIVDDYVDPVLAANKCCYLVC